MDKDRLETLLGEATVDCYDAYEGFADVTCALGQQLQWWASRWSSSGLTRGAATSGAVSWTGTGVPGRPGGAGVRGPGTGQRGVAASLLVLVESRVMAVACEGIRTLFGETLIRGSPDASLYYGVCINFWCRTCAGTQ